MSGSSLRTRRRRAWVAVALGLSILLSGIPLGATGISSAFPSPALPTTSPSFPAGSTTAGPNASLVLGQPNFNRTGPGTTAATLCGPRDAAVDASGNLWVSDSCNNRVLEFVPPFYPGISASLVLGQTSFTSGAPSGGATGLRDPVALAFDARGDLWVADSGNNRILEFVPPFRTGMAATLAIGQPNLTANGSGTSATQLRDPSGVAVAPNGDLWIADTGNNRLLEFALPFSVDEAASLVLGQKTFEASIPATSPSGLRSPASVAVAANGTVYVADTGNDRVLAYPAPSASGAAAVGVLGQTNLYSGGPGSGPSGFDDPGGIALGAASTIWVADTANNRVVRFGLPIVDGEAATYVAGQPALTTNASGPAGSGSLNGTAGVAYDPTTLGVWMADTLDARMLELPGNAHLVSSVTVVPASGDAAALNSLTRLNVTLSGVSDAQPLLVVTQVLSAPPTDAFPTPFANASYFNVAVSPPGAGTARACFTVSGVDSASLPEYWSGSAWISVPTALSGPGTVCVSVPLSLLLGTTFAVRLTTPPPASTAGTSLLIFGTIAFVLAAAGLVIVYNLRRRQRGPPATPEPRYRSPL